MSTPAAPYFPDSRSLFVPPPQLAIGALWRRILAVLLDSIIVGTAVTLTAIPFFEPLSRIGFWGRALGFCLALPYFGLLNSRITSGQTLGKKVLRLRVVARNGEPISVGKAIARYSVFGLPFFLNNITLPVSKTPPFVLNLLAVLIFGLGFVLIYLVLFNRHTRQGPHDLLVGSYVVDADSSGAVNAEPIWTGHWIIIGVLLVAGVLAGIWFQRKVTGMVDMPAMMADLKVIEDMPDVQAGGVSDLTWYSGTSNERKKIYVVRVIWSGPREQEANLVNSIADHILQHNPDVKSRDYLRILVIRGYDLGIAHAEVTQSFEDTPANWQTKLHTNVQ